MKNEVPCKVLCHNICCLISAIYELGITPNVSTGDRAPQAVETETSEPRLLAAANGRKTEIS
jgi:hypothetical protein